MSSSYFCVLNCLHCPLPAAYFLCIITLLITLFIHFRICIAQAIPIITIRSKLQITELPKDPSCMHDSLKFSKATVLDVVLDVDEKLIEVAGKREVKKIEILSYHFKEISFPITKFKPFLMVRLNLITASVSSFMVFSL